MVLLLPPDPHFSTPRSDSRFLPGPGLAHTVDGMSLSKPTITGAFFWTYFLLLTPSPFSVVFFTFSQNGPFKIKLFTISYFQKKN